ncbi:4'-phosphopantetheinyl transferase superfamily [Thamnidium elegans]|nr:4'-phosphopantetheinyl transferase superfamily [Thamnidium elegans]
MDLLAFNIKDAFEGEKFKTALSWLPDHEHSSVTRFKYERDQHLALTSLLLRRHYFSQRLQVPWPSLQFDRLPKGKPILKNEEIDFNISHEGSWVIFGATKERGLQIGVDTVIIDRPKSISIDEFIKSFLAQLTQQELELIKSNQDQELQLRTFYELWACKESYIKAIGVGLSLDLSKLDFRNENDQIILRLDGKDLTSWTFHLSSLDKDTIAVVCYGSPDQQTNSTVQLAFNTKLLAKEPLHTITKTAFDQLNYQELKNNKWIVAQLQT